MEKTRYEDTDAMLIAQQGISGDDPHTKHKGPLPWYGTLAGAGMIIAPVILSVSPIWIVTRTERHSVMRENENGVRDQICKGKRKVHAVSKSGFCHGKPIMFSRQSGIKAQMAEHDSDLWPGMAKGCRLCTMRSMTRVSFLV